MTTLNKASDFLTVDEAAELAGVTHWAIRRWLGSSKKLTRYKSGSRTVVSRTELLELIKPRKAEGQAK
jgi:excisionase family DNA binding protein